MQALKSRSPRSGEREESLTSLMQKVVETRSRMTRARERLRMIEERIKNIGAEYHHQRDKALQEYIEAQSKAKLARTQLLKELRERAA